MFEKEHGPADTYLKDMALQILTCACTASVKELLHPNQFN